MYYSGTEGMLNLNDLVSDLTGWDYLRAAKDITDSGLILGDGYTSEGEHHFFILSEITNNTPIPEPSTMLLLGTGLIGLAGWGRKKFKRR